MNTADLRAALMARKSEIERIRLDELTRLQREADQALAPYVAAAGEVERMLHLLDHADGAAHEAEIPNLGDIVVPPEEA